MANDFGFSIQSSEIKNQILERRELYDSLMVEYAFIQLETYGNVLCVYIHHADKSKPSFTSIIISLA